MDKPGFLEGIYGMLFNPGGDVDGLRHAAFGCRKLSTDLIARADALDGPAVALANFWQGKSSDGFQASWKKFHADLSDYAQQMDTDAAASIDRIADLIHEAQVQAHDVKIMILATIATGVAATIFTFGLSDALSACAVETEVAGLELFMARMAALLAGEAEAISALVSALMTTIGRFLVAFIASEASSMAVKGLVFHQNVLDPANWTAKDLSKALLDGDLVMGMGALFSTGKLGAAMDAHPYLGFAAAGASGSAAFSAISQFWFDHASLTDPKSWFNLAKSTGIGGVSGLGVAGLFHGLPSALASLRSPGTAVAGDTAGEQLVLFGPNGEPIIEPLMGPHGRALFPEQRFPSSNFGIAINGADLARTGTGLGSDMINYIINYPRPPEGVAAPGAPGSGPAISDFPVPQPHERPHPTVGGGSYTVRRGDSLWDIASRTYGDGNQWTKIAAANPHISNPSLIYAGTVVHLPKLPAPQPAGAG